MPGIIKQFKNKLKTINLFPITLTKAVYTEDNKRLDNIIGDTTKLPDASKGICENIDGLNSNLSNIKVPLAGLVLSSDYGNAPINPNIPSNAKIKQVSLSYTFTNVISYDLHAYIGNDEKQVTIHGNANSKGKTLGDGFINIWYY